MDIERGIQVVLWQRKLGRARNSLIEFIEFMHPDVEDPEDVSKSAYSAQLFHRHIAGLMERMIFTMEYLLQKKGKLLLASGCRLPDWIEDPERRSRREAISAPPQYGKSVIFQFAFAWAFGRNPRMNGIYATYNQDFAADRGAFVRGILTNQRFKKVFPDFDLQQAERSKEIMVSKDRGQLLFIGLGGTGRPSDMYLIDDPYKTKQDAESSAISESIWTWLTTAAITRMRSSSVLGIIHTRWVDGDLIGRLCDPTSDAYNPAIARFWNYTNIPSIFEYIPAAGIDDRDIAAICGKEIGDTLWPEEFALEDMLQRREMDTEGFNALMQGRPTSMAGEFFPAECLREYKSEDELPPALVYYGASDHSIGQSEGADRSCLGVIGVDHQMNIWVMPDLIWQRIETDKQVEELIRLSKKYRCQSWFPEAENISKAMGPFLRKRMNEEQCFTAIVPQRPSKDKVAMAASLQGMIKMRRVYFPSFAHWWNPPQKRMANRKVMPSARRELIKFPKTPHDDFVSFLSLACFGLDWMWRAVKPAEPEKKYAKGSFGEMLKLMQDAEDDLDMDLNMRAG